LGLPAQAAVGAGGNVHAGSIARAIELIRAAQSTLYSIAETVQYLRQLVDGEETHDGLPAGRPWRVCRRSYGWPQDALDACLVLLTLTEHLQATQNEKPVLARQLDQSKIGPASFRVESRALSVKEKIRLRTLLQTVGIKCDPNEEAVEACNFLKELQARADNAGGEPPLPARPDTKRLDDLTQQSGNEQLASILAAEDRVGDKSDAKAREAIGELENRHKERRGWPWAKFGWSLESLQSAGITIYGWVTGEIEDALAVLLRGGWSLGSRTRTRPRA